MKKKTIVDYEVDMKSNVEKTYIADFVKNSRFFFFVKVFFLLFIFCFLFCYKISFSMKQNAPMPTDTRIKTFVYNPNEIFQAKFMVGYQSILELQDGEDVEMITFGDPGPWKVTVIGRRIFLKATDPGVKTNMTIITDKRTYLMEISSNSDDADVDEQITYILRFFYPDINVDIPPTTTKLAKIALNKRISASTRKNKTIAKGAIANASSVNTNYTYSGESSNILPTMVFDNGSKTYFKFKDEENIPIISAVGSDFKEIPLRVRKSGDYVYVDTVEYQLTLRKDKELICIFNEAQIKSMAYVNGD